MAPTSYINKRETEILKHLHSIIKDTNDYFKEINAEMKLNEEESYSFKIKFLSLLSMSLGVSESYFIENNYQKIVEQNQNLQSALIESNKILDKIQSNLEECCDECICALNEHNMNKDRMTFQDITEEIKRLQEN